MQAERFCGGCFRATTCELHRHVKISGAHDFCWVCTNCKKVVKSKAGGLWIAKRAVEGLLSAREIGVLPVLNPAVQVECERCYRSGVEYHHWMPRALSEDADQWPGGYLCRSCHEEWHRLVTPGLIP